MKKIIAIMISLAAFAQLSMGQCGSGPILTVNNPSFEGTPAPHVTPPGWDICMPGVTPDTQPGSWGQTLPPSNGSSYLGLVNAPSMGWQEGAGQNLSSPMVAGTAYNFTVDLAVPASADPVTGIVLPPYCVQLQLWGGMSGVNSGCDQSQLLWTSPSITNTVWQTYNLTFTPTANWDHILFCIYTIPPPCTDGQYLFLDNMSSINPIGDVAEFIWTDICLGNNMQFTDSSYSPSGTINGWSWNFGDGNTSTQQNPSHNYLTSGSYNVQLTTYSNVPCTTIVTHIVNVWAIPTVTVSGGGSICTGMGNTVPVTFTFTGAPPWNLTYTDGGTPTTVNGINTSPYTVNVSSAGTYTATAFSDSHCTGTISGNAVVAVNNLPNVTFGQQPNVCINLPAFALTGGSPAGGTYSGTAVNSNMFDPLIAGPGTHTLTYTYTDPSTGCTNSAQQTIQVGTDMSVVITPLSATICAGASVMLTCTAADVIHWSPTVGLSDTNTAMLVASPTTTTTYTVNVTNSAGCTGFSTITITVKAISPISFFANPTEGCEPLHVDFDYTPGPDILDSSWVWTFGDNYSDTAYSVLQDPSHYYSTEGVFNVMLNATTVDGCIGKDSMDIIVYPIPAADFIMHPNVADMDNPAISFVDQSIDAASWLWDFDDPTSGNHNWAADPSPVHVFTDSGTYHVTLMVESNYGCADTVTKPITIYPQLLIYIPNAFTPNANGLNDMFIPSITGYDPTTFNMFIFDRWGQELFRSEDLTVGWDGRARSGDKVCQAGVYSYIIYITDMRGKEHKLIGHVSIIR